MCDRLISVARNEIKRNKISDLTQIKRYAIIQNVERQATWQINNSKSRMKKIIWYKSGFDSW